MRILVILLLAVVTTAQTKPQVPKWANKEQAECQITYIWPHYLPFTVIYEQITPPLTTKTQPTSKDPKKQIVPTFKRIDPPPLPPVRVIGYHCYFDKGQPPYAPFPYNTAKWAILGANLAVVPLPEESIK